jgi:DME family drug/metabolite transporter
VAIDAAGVLLALGAALGFGLYLLGADIVLKETNSLTGSAWVAAFASIGLAVWAVATGDGRVPHGWHQWYPILGMGTFTAGAFVCLFAGLRRLGAVRTAIISATEPLTAAALAAAFLDERLGAATALGGLLILAGAVAASLARGETSAEAPGP